MHLVSRKKQTVYLNGDIITIENDERILTEYSYKYSINMLKDIIRDSFYIDKFWTDSNGLFGLFLLRLGE